MMRRCAMDVCIGSQRANRESQPGRSARQKPIRLRWSFQCRRFKTTTVLSSGATMWATGRYRALCPRNGVGGRCVMGGMRSVRSRDGGNRRVRSDGPSYPAFSVLAFGGRRRRVPALHAGLARRDGGFLLGGHPACSRCRCCAFDQMAPRRKLLDRGRRHTLHGRSVACERRKRTLGICGMLRRSGALVDCSTLARAPSAWRTVRVRSVPRGMACRRFDGKRYLKRFANSSLATFVRRFSMAR